MKENEKTKRKTKTASRKKRRFATVKQFRTGKGKGKRKGKGKGVCWNCGDGDHHSRDCLNEKQDTVGQKQCCGKATKIQETAKVQAKDGTQEKATSKGKGKESQPDGEWSSTKGKLGSKGKRSICSVDGIPESDGWTQSDVANCIMEHSQDVLMEDITARRDPLRQNVAPGAMKLGDQHEWRSGRFKNLLKK